MANEMISIIEDNEVNRVLVRDMLQFKGYRTIAAPSADDGLRVAREKKPVPVVEFLNVVEHTPKTPEKRA